MRQISGVKLTNELLEHTNTKELAKNTGYRVDSYRMLVEQVAKLSYLNKDYLLFYRGQANDHKNKVGKSSFYPTIYRDKHLKQQELDYKFDKLYSASNILSGLFKNNKIEGQYELRRKKYIQWSILQHYEVTETPLIDITQSLRVACSFAQIDNKKETAYIYVFGFPYYTNRISINSEQDLINIRLLSITPPQALRPYFQEGFLAGTDDITNIYERKEELDLNNRLIAKFEIPNSKTFWGNSFDSIPLNALYPDNDEIETLCKEISTDLDDEKLDTTVGTFLRLWVEIERAFYKNLKKNHQNASNNKELFTFSNKHNELSPSLYKELEDLRRFRNIVVHKPTKIASSDLANKINILKEIKNTVQNDN